MNNLYDEIVKRLEKIDFEQLYLGFKRYHFALYDDEWVYLRDRKIPRDNRFLGNTAITFEDGYLAIWYKPEGDLNVLTANIVHEMFHVHQTILKEKKNYR